VALAVGAARLLLEGGADPNLTTRTTVTPLMAAADHGQAGVLRLLLEHGAARPGRCGQS
jgi:ankyrin repeat protein